MSLRFFRLSFAACLLLAAFSANAQTPPPAATPARSPAAGSEELVGPIKLADADIDTVLGALEIYTGRTILRPQALPTANYTLKLNKQVPKSEVVTALETLLALNGVGVSPLGEKFLKVVALNQVKTEAPEMIDGSTLGLPASGRIATKLFQLEFLRVNEFVPQIAPMMSPGVANGLVPLDKANAVLVTDSISNLQRVENLIGLIDQPNARGLTPKFYPLHGGAKASDLVNKLHLLFQGPLQAQLGSATTYSADDRTNQIILLADPRQYALFDDLIAKLDTVAEPNTRNEIIYLKHATAKDVASLLSQLVSGQNNATQKANSAGSVRPTAPGQPAQTPAAPNAASAAVIASLAESTNQFSSLITVLADDRSNAVIVSGTLDDIRLIRDLVSKIDIVLAQVRIEVIIAEVTLSDTDTSGVNALNLTFGPGGSGGTHITNFDTGTSANGIAGWNITGGVVNPLAFQAALGNTGSKNLVKILSAPTIVTTHNKQATMTVTQQQPVITGTTSTPTTGATTTSSGFSTSSQVTYKDIGITLKVTPLIGDDGNIQLDVDQTVDDVISNVTIDGNQQPVIGHREATGSVTVQDGKMIVLGGLQRSSRSLSRTKLGFLFEIPIISQLLGGRNNDTERTELLLFIRPHVLRPEESTADTQKKINDLSNKEQVNQYLVDPTKQPKDSLIDKLK